MKEPNYDLNKIRDSRLGRLAKEHIKLHELCSKSLVVDYRILEEDRERPFPPSKYLITFRLKSLTGIDEAKSPLYGDTHQVEISLPLKYPIHQARCYMKTDFWHPNVKCHESEGEKGYICTNIKEFGARYNLDELVLRLGALIKYEICNVYDPVDLIVAEWVKEVVITTYGSRNAEALKDEAVPTWIAKIVEIEKGIEAGDVTLEFPLNDTPIVGPEDDDDDDSSGITLLSESHTKPPESGIQFTD